jgi:transposase
MLVDDPDEKVPCRPTACGNCAGDLAEAKVFAAQRRQVFDLPAPPKPYFTEYLVESLLCGGCGEVTCGQAPDGVAGRLQYGPGAKARMVYLRGAQYLPFGRATHADFATLRSYLSTATKHGQDLLDVLTALFTTGPWLPPDPAANPS